MEAMRAKAARDHGRAIARGRDKVAAWGRRVAALCRWRGHRVYHGCKSISRFTGKTEIACKSVQDGQGVPQIGPF